MRKLITLIIVAAFGIYIFANIEHRDATFEIFAEIFEDAKGDLNKPQPQTPDVQWPADLDRLTLSGKQFVVSEPQSKPYNRSELFGKDWGYDFDGNGCDTRNDILARDLTHAVVNERCQVLSGVLHDKYTGKTVEFKRGVGTSAAVQIDHIVPLSWANKQGAHDWTQDQRLAFANDPMNLIAVDGPTNSSKGDSGLTWLPPNEDYHCEYLSDFLNVVSTYKLSLPPADAAVAQDLSSKC